MFWQQRPDPDNWIDQIRYFTDFNNKLTEDELRDAFINLAHKYVTDLLRSFNYRDLIIADFIERRIYDTELINSYLIACNEEPLFNHKRSIS